MVVQNPQPSGRTTAAFGNESGRAELPSCGRAGSSCGGQPPHPRLTSHCDAPETNEGAPNPAKRCGSWMPFGMAHQRSDQSFGASPAGDRLDQSYGPNPQDIVVVSGERRLLA